MNRGALFWKPKTEIPYPWASVSSVLLHISNYIRETVLWLPVEDRITSKILFGQALMVGSAPENIRELCASQVDEYCTLQHVLRSHIQWLANTDPSRTLDLHGTISNFNLELCCFKYIRKHFLANLKIHLILDSLVAASLRFLMCVHSSLVFSMLNCQPSGQGRHLFHAFCSICAPSQLAISLLVGRWGSEGEEWSPVLVCQDLEN